MALVVIILAVVLGYLLYRWGTRNHDFWTSRGVPGPKPVPFFGTQMDLLLTRTSPAAFFRRVYTDFGDSPYVGMLSASRASLHVRDPELIKHVLTKDFEYFPDRGVPFNEKLSPLSGHLFNIEGVRWKNLRIKLTPTFTSGKIKRMYPLLEKCARELGAVVQNHASRGEAVDFKDVLARFSTDVIGSCAFGVECNSLKDPNAEFRRQGMRMFQVSLKSKLRMVLFSYFPKADFLHALFKDTSFEEFFLNVTRENVRFREEQNVKRDDFLDLLIELKHKGKLVDDKVDVIEDPFLKVPVAASADELKFTDTTLAAQAFVFFVAGFETSSTTMSFCLLELAHHPDIQQKLQCEIDSALKRNEGISYQALSEMTYLDKVVSETLRKYPPLPALSRRAIKPYQLPGSKLVMETGMRAIIPVFGLHYDPAFYPDPERFDPERFSPEAKAARHPYTYLPFGEGPRICIGMRFGLLQTKLGLVSVLSRFTVEPSADTRYPVRFKKGAFLTASEDECHLIVKERVQHDTLDMNRTMDCGSTAF